MKFIYDSIESNLDASLPITELSRKSVRVILMARSQMLQCANNFKGAYNRSGLCRFCNVLDTEKHRMNFCPQWKKDNEFYNFDDVFSSDVFVMNRIVSSIEKFWNLDLGKNEMRK